MSSPTLIRNTTITESDSLPSLQIQNLEKSYGDVEVLRSINLDVQRGEFLTLLGPSGSGKTTLLKIIAGFESATRGQLLLSGTDISVLRPSERQLGMVFQNYSLFPHMTVAENIAYGLKVRKYKKAAIRARVDQMIETVGLEQHASKSPSQLSGGQQQRVALARALAYEPEILLMDEPLGALDRTLRLQMEQEIKRVHRETGTTIIYVTHNQDEALVLSDRVAIMNDGVFAGLDTPMNLFTRPENAFVARFFSDANLFNGTVSDGVLKIGNQQIVVETALRGPVQVAVRPSKVLLGDTSRFPEGLRFDALVREHVLLGEQEEFEVECSDQTTLTVRRAIGSGPPVSIGEATSVSISRSDMTLMRN